MLAASMVASVMLEFAWRADAGTETDLDQWVGHAGDGVSRVGQDPAEAPQPVRPIQRVGPDGP